MIGTATLETPVVVETAPLLVAQVHVNVPRSEIQLVMGPAIAEVYAAVVAQGRTPAGPWFTHHQWITPDLFDFDACVPVDQPVTPVGRVVPGEWPATRAVRTVYTGPYEGLGEAWGAFKAWLAREGHSGRTDLYERYLVGPETGLPPAEYRTELIQPLA